MGIDPRALAAFRIALGLILLGDLLFLRVPGLRTFYTDDGTLPRSALAEFYPMFETFSLHALSGSAWAQGLLFAAAGVFAGLLLVGYRTTLATLASALLLASMQARNPYVLNGGDTILLSLLVLGLFLPLGARWSIDAHRNNDRSPADVDGRVCSVATATILVHFTTIYAVNGVLKTRSEAWLRGEAVPQIFHLEQFIVGIGPYLADQTALLVAANWFWSMLLMASPLLLVFSDRLRLALASAFVGAQLGLATTMRLGAFPFVMVAALLLFFPPRVWDRLEGALERADLERRLTSTADVIATDGGRRRPVPWSLPSLPSIAVPSTVRRGARIVGNVALVCGLVTLLVWQAAGIGVVDIPEEVVGDEVDDVSWAFFAPEPISGTWWYAWEADLASGERVDTLRDESGAIDRPPDAADRYPSTLWMRYGLDMRSAGESEYEPFAAYLCDRLGTETGADVESVTVYSVEQPVDASGPVGDLEVDQRIEYGC